MRVRSWAITAAAAAVVANHAGLTRGSTFSAITQVQTDSGPQSLQSVIQVVLQNNGDLAAVVDVGDDLTNSLVYGAGGATPGVIATANTTIYSQIGGSSTGAPTFSDFTNLALSRDSAGTERLSFLGITQTEAGTTQGIYQVNPAAPATTGFRIAATGDPIIPGSDARTFAPYDRGSNQVGYQVDASGNVVVAGTASGTQVILSGNSTGNSLLVQASANVDQDFVTSADVYNQPDAKKPVINSGHTVYLATQVVESQTQRNILANPSTSPRYEQGGLGATGLVPRDLIGANSGGEIFVGTITSGSNTQSAVYYHNNTGATLTQLTPMLGMHNETITGDTGEMTPAGHAAFYANSVPDSGSAFQDLYYFDGAASHLIATSGTSIANNGQTIDAMSFDGSAPMVNDNGYVVFTADLLDGQSVDHQAVLDWKYNPSNPNADPAPTVLLEQGQNLTTAQTGTIPVDFIQGILSDGATADVLKDGLSDDNALAFGVDSGNNAYIVETLLPEPSAALLWLTGGTIWRLSRRRGRRAKVATGC
jgi:hypothetical protein